MKPVYIAAAAVLPLALASCASTSSSAEATSSSAYVVDDPATYYVGEWKTTKHALMTDEGERSAGSMSMTIEEIQDNLFKATRVVELKVPADFGVGEKKPTATVEAPGVVNPDNTLTIVKAGGPGEVNVWPVDQDTIEYTYIQSGATPWVARGTMVRQ